MRIKLILRSKEDIAVIPINYQYPLSCEIYKILSKASLEYSNWLHNKGYVSPSGRIMKLFVFSKLKIDKIHIEKNTFIIDKNSRCELLVSSPMLSSFVQNFILGTFEAKEIEIGIKEIKGKFRIEEIQFVEEPKFSDNMKFICLSPVVSSTVHQKNNKKQTYYFRALDEDLNKAISKNLVEKYKMIHDEEINDPKIDFLINKDYIERKGGAEGVSKLITIKEGLKSEIKIKGFVAPFILRGNSELIKTAYECGIGQYNSLGCGMVEVYKNILIDDM
jgi:CRISPR-associated endoribonuclease Cas6